MIEVPPHFLNLVFMLLIVMASINRSKTRSGWDGWLPPRSIGFQD